MASKTFVDYETVVDAAWLNDVDKITYDDDGASQVGYTPAGTGAVATNVQTKLQEFVSVKDFGATGDGVTNDASAIQSGIDYLESIGGGVLEFESATYAISTGLVVNDSNVTLLGKGSGTGVYGGKTTVRDSASTTIKWTGATGSGTMLQFTTDTADGGTEIQKSGGGIEGIMLDCAEKAAIGLEVQSWQYGVFKDVHVIYAYTYGYKIWTLSNGVLSGVEDTQRCLFENCQYSEVSRKIAESFEPAEVF
jgi:hypothetical protein